MRAFTPRIIIKEVIEQQTENLDIKCASLLPCSTNYGNQIEIVENLDNFIFKFGYPNLDNAKYWWQIANYLSYTNQGIYVVRPVKTTDINYSIKLTGESTKLNNVENTNLYNYDLSQNLVFNTTLSDYSMEIFNRYVEDESKVAITVVDNETDWELPITDEQISTIRDLDVYQYNTISTAYINRYVIKFDEHSLTANDIYSDNGTANTFLVLSGNRSHIESEKYIRLIDDTPQDILRQISVDGVTYNGYREESVEIVFSYSFNSGSVEPVLGDILTGLTSTKSGTVYSVDVTSGTWGGGDAAGTIELYDLDGEIDLENIEINGDSTDRLTITVKPDFVTGVAPKFLLLGNHQYLNTSEIVNIKDDETNYTISAISYNDTEDKTEITTSYIVNAFDEVTDSNFLAIQSDTTSIIIDSTFTPSVPVTLYYLADDWNDIDQGLGGTLGSVLEHGSNGEVWEYNETNTLWEKNTTLLVDNNNYFVKNDNKVYSYLTSVFTETTLGFIEIDRNTAILDYYSSEIVGFEGIRTYAQIFDTKPDFLNGEFVLAVFKKNQDDKYELKETFVLDYSQKSEIYVYENSNYIYAKLNSSVSSGDGVNTKNYSIVDLTIEVDTTKNYSNINYYTYNECYETAKLYLDKDSYIIDYLMGFKAYSDTSIYDLDIMSKIAKERENSLAINSVWEESTFFGKTEDEITTEILNNFGNADHISTAKTQLFSEYAGFFGNMGLQYDKYLNQYHWIPINGDVAGNLIQNELTSGVGYDNELQNVSKLLFNISKFDNRKKLNRNGINNIIYNNLKEAIVFDSITTVTNLDSIFREFHKRKTLNMIKNDLRQLFFKQILKLLSNDRIENIETLLQSYFQKLYRNGLIKKNYTVNLKAQSSKLNVKISLEFVDILRTVDILVSVQESNIEIQEI